MEVNNLLKIGKKLKIYFNKNNINNKNIEIRAIIDNDYIVYKSYSNSRKTYIYHIESIYYFELLCKSNYLIER